jgi:hypothetical protein
MMYVLPGLFRQRRRQTRVGEHALQVRVWGRFRGLYKARDTPPRLVRAQK